MRRLPPHGKEKCGSPRVTLRLHQLKEKKKDKFNSITGDHHDNYNCRGMDSVNKNGNGANDDSSTNKEQAGNNCDENGSGGPNGSEHKENANSGTPGVTPSNQSSTAGDSDHHHSNDGTSTGGATVKRSHSTDEDDDSKKKRRKDEGGRGKSGSNSGGSPKSLIGVESEGEDAKSVESPGPKVPPLKIVIAGASLEEPGTGGRNGKNGSGRHHLPYVVSTTATTSTNSSSSGATATSANSANSSNNNSSNSNTTTADTGSTNVGSSGDVHSASISEEPVGPKSPADEPVTSPSGTTSTATGRPQRVLRSHRTGGGSGKEERGNGSSGHPSPAGVTLSESGSPRLVEGGSPNPSVGESVGTSQSGGISSSTLGVPETVNVDDKGNSNSSTANNSANNSVSVEVKVSGNNGSSTTSEEPVTTSGSQTNTTSGQVQATSTISQPSSIPSTELHPRKRKMRPKDTNNSNNNNNNNNNNTNTNPTAISTGNSSPTATTTTTTTSTSGNVGQNSPGSNISSANGGANGLLTQSNTQNGSNATGIGQTESTGTIEPPGPSSNLQHLDQSVTNSYQLFLNIRKQIERKRKGLFPVQPKPPQGFKDYLMNRCTYVLASNASNRVPPPSTNPPANLQAGIKDLYIAQEKERHRLLMQHVIEKEKLVLSVEQEILRVHGRAARALANQALPFSACTILRDEEVYSAISPEQEEKDRNQARSRYNGRLFLSWLQDVDDKWEKIKEAMLVRHHNEAESLHAVQKMDWEWKMKELGLCEMKSNPVIDETHVPMVHVSDDFDLLPA